MGIKNSIEVLYI